MSSTVGGFSVFPAIKFEKLSIDVFVFPYSADHDPVIDLSFNFLFCVSLIQLIGIPTRVDKKGAIIQFRELIELRSYSVLEECGK